MSRSIVCGYRDDPKLRASFNELAEKVFGLNFEGWYQNGYWKDNYNPYSVVVDGKVVSNVSVNRCDVNDNGRRVRLIQLGTVMTDPGHRGKGYAGELMERVLSDYEGKVDGIYLFANDSVTSFYPKFGFKEGKEHQFSKAVANAGERRAEAVPMACRSDWDRMEAIIGGRAQNGRMYMVGNTGLYMFYLSQFMQENVFYLPDSDTYVVAEEAEDTLILHAVFGDCDIDRVIAAFGKDIKKAVFCFTPKDPSGFTKQELHEEDTTLFVRGAFFDEAWDDDAMFQAITHA